ncbi:MAG TPA: hypothetical protein VGW40_13615 [Allosphingosinicella sp.]|nr:hypothetical protein [Allosphingosinicella sp.]
MGKQAPDQKRSFDEERAYIENLLNMRFNYYLVFASLLFLPVTSENALSPAARAGLMVLGGVVSALMAYMVIRTKKLLDALLTEILKDNEHPYTGAFNTLKVSFFRINANDLMVAAVLAIMAVFLAGGTVALRSPATLFKTDAAATPAQALQRAQTPPPAPEKPGAPVP